MSENVIRVNLIVRGKVQGVCYRAFSEDMANKYSIKGYVKNLSSGDVEITAEGDRKNIESFVSKLWEGPPMAIVRDIRKSEDKYKEEFRDFSVKF
ncbi:MAG: acylphosphatase [bacterium]